MLFQVGRDRFRAEERLFSGSILSFVFVEAKTLKGHLLSCLTRQGILMRCMEQGSLALNSEGLIQCWEKKGFVQPANNLGGGLVWGLP